MRWDNPEIVERELIRPWAESIPLRVPHKRRVKKVEYDPETKTAKVNLEIIIPKELADIQLNLELTDDGISFTG